MGKFGPGNQAAAGRSSREADLRKAFSEAVSPEGTPAIASALVASETGGDIQAARLILQRCRGKPAPDPDEEVSTPTFLLPRAIPHVGILDAASGRQADRTGRRCR